MARLKDNKLFVSIERIVCDYIYDEYVFDVCDEIEDNLVSSSRTVTENNEPKFTSFVSISCGFCKSYSSCEKRERLKGLINENEFFCGEIDLY